MPGKVTLITVFLFALTLFLLLLMPARVLVDRLPVLSPGGQPLVLDQVRGPWWRATGRWRWQSLHGELSWTLQRRGLVPGVRLRATGEQQARLVAWLGADWGRWQLSDARLSLPLSDVSSYVPQGDADGRLDMTLITLRFDNGAVSELQGNLQYSGGTVSWPGNGAATVPVLDGIMLMDQGSPTLSVSDPDGVQLMLASLVEQRLQVQVLRAWPQLLGVSQGGSPDDVVFQLSQPLQLP